MAGRRITIEFLGKDSTGPSVSAVEKRYGKLGSRLDKVGHRAGQVLAVGLLAAGAAAVKMGQAAVTDEAAASKLAQTLKTAAGATKGQVAATEEWITAQGKSLGISDDELRPALGRLAVATKDVGKAQKLASLAMDISAGSGKSLEAVSTALGKAQNGNVGALGRLGIKTKDVHGKTLSLEQITKNLAETYNGAASKAADTNAGKQKKLSVAFGELQEEIGAKLLPVMQKLTDAGLKMVDWVGRNQTTVKVLVSVVGTLAAGLYLASAAMRFMTMVTTAQELAAKRAAASTAAGATSFGASSIAMRTGALAAAAGLSVLAAKAGGAETSVGALATVGAGVAAGFAVGGPWGAAIGGAGGLLSVFTHRGDAAAESQKRMKAAVGTVTATLDAQTGAMTKLTRSTVAKTLADTGAFTAGKKLGLSYKEVLDAALGSEKATKKVDAATRAYTKSHMDSIPAVQKAAKTTGVLTQAVHGTTGAIADERRKIDQVNSAMGNLNGKQAKLKIWADTDAAFAKLHSIQRYINGMNGKTVKIAVKGGTPGGITGNAKGTDNWRGGLTWVGEEGPEIVNLPKGSQVIPNHKTEQYMASHAPSGSSVARAGGGGGGDQTIVVPVYLDSVKVAQSLVRLKANLGRPLGLA